MLPGGDTDLEGTDVLRRSTGLTVCAGLEVGKLCEYRGIS